MTTNNTSDFVIPASLQEREPELVDLILKSESMDDGERQYWFNLLEVMNEEQVEKLRGILTREQEKLAAIDKKYGKKAEVDPEVAQQKAESRIERQKDLKQREAEHNAKEEAEQEAILAELDNL